MQQNILPFTRRGKKQLKYFLFPQQSCLQGDIPELLSTISWINLWHISNIFPLSLPASFPC